MQNALRSRFVLPLPSFILHRYTADFIAVIHNAPGNRAHGAEGQNRSCSFKWAATQEKIPASGDAFSHFHAR